MLAEVHGSLFVHQAKAISVIIDKSKHMWAFITDESSNFVSQVRDAVIFRSNLCFCTSNGA